MQEIDDFVASLPILKQKHALMIRPLATTSYRSRTTPAWKSAGSKQPLFTTVHKGSGSSLLEAISAINENTIISRVPVSARLRQCL